MKLQFVVLLAVVACSGPRPSPSPPDPKEVSGACETLVALGCIESTDIPDCKTVYEGPVDFDLECVQRSSDCDEAFDC